jgi:hypothetical protein
MEAYRTNVLSYLYTNKLNVMKRLLLLIAMMVAGYSFTWAQRDVTGTGI